MALYFVLIEVALITQRFSPSEPVFSLEALEQTEESNLDQHPSLFGCRGHRFFSDSAAWTDFYNQPTHFYQQQHQDPTMTPTTSRPHDDTNNTKTPTIIPPRQHQDPTSSSSNTQTPPSSSNITQQQQHRQAAAAESRPQRFSPCNMHIR